MGRFLSDLDIALIGDNDNIWRLDSPLIYESDRLGMITVPEGFQTDLASVPRLPVLYMLWGNKAHREAIIHDLLYRIDSDPQASFSEANSVFLEAMTCRGKSCSVRWPMYWGVCLGGRGSYHKRRVHDVLV